MKNKILFTTISIVNLLFSFQARAQQPQPAPTPASVYVPANARATDAKISAGLFSFSLYPGVYLNGDGQNFSTSSSASSTQDALRNMYMFGVRVGHPFTKEIETELDFFYSPTKTGGFNLFVYNTSINGVYNFFISKSIVPYIIAGPGLLTLNTDQITTESKFSVGAGAGVKLFLSDRFAIRPEVRALATFSDFNAAFLGSLMLTYYVDFLHRHPVKDADGDGISDNLDKCPTEMETFNGYMDEDGCPDTVPIKDTDGDGILDNVDKCPTEKESVNGYMDDDGCPDVAPELPKAFVAPTPTPVDPNKDTDSDGVVDTQDKCQTEKETMNNYLDDDGCPDTIPKELKSFTGKVDGIYFATSSSVIEKRSYKILDQAVEVFKKFPNLAVKIDGHTDNTGSKKFNLYLSKERAESVRQYLGSRGIDSSRLTIEGFGPSKPVTSNATSTGRSQNRRIEFKLREINKTPANTP